MTKSSPDLPSKCMVPNAEVCRVWQADLRLSDQTLVYCGERCLSEALLNGPLTDEEESLAGMVARSSRAVFSEQPNVGIEVALASTLSPTPEALERISDRILAKADELGDVNG